MTKQAIHAGQELTQGCYRVLIIMVLWQDFLKKACLWVCDQVWLNPACSATVTSLNIKLLHDESLPYLLLIE